MMVAGEGIAPPTQGFSGPCSTTELPSRPIRKSTLIGVVPNVKVKDSPTLSGVRDRKLVSYFTTDQLWSNISAICTAFNAAPFSN